MTNWIIFVALVAPNAAEAELSLECKCDATRVRLGEPAYCAAYLRNRGAAPIRLEQPLSVAFGITTMTHRDGTHESFSLGGSVAAAGGGALVVAPRGQVLVAVGQVPLYSSEILRRGRRPAAAAIKASLYHAEEPRGMGCPETEVVIDGDLGKTPTVLSRIYTPFSNHSPVNAKLAEQLNLGPQVSDFGLREVPPELNLPPRLNELIDLIDRESTVYRIVSITQAVRACIAAPPEQKAGAVDRILGELQPCGVAERRWLTRRILGELARFGDTTSRSLLLERADPATYAAPATNELRMHLRFDQNQVRCGDPWYCEVRVYNRGLESCKIEEPSAGIDLGFTVELVGKSVLLAHVGGSACGGGAPVCDVAPNGYLATWAQVPIFSGDTLRDLGGSQGYAVVTAGCRYAATPQPIRVEIEGDIGKRKKLAAEFQVPWNDLPMMTDEWLQIWKKTPTFSDFELHQTPWPWNVPPRFDTIFGELHPDSAIYHIASIVRCLRLCIAAPEANKKAAVDQLIGELNRYGPCERQWLMMQVPSILTDKDNLSRQLFLQRTADEPCLARWRQIVK